MSVTGLQGNLLDEPIFHYRTVANGTTVAVSLPELFAALAADEVRDFPALRTHQRHPWHALLVQLGALALYRTGSHDIPATAEQWRSALLALTPDDPDGAAWCLETPPERPAFLQSPVLEGHLTGWKTLSAADELDMLVTAKNHDIKSARMHRATAEQWCFALVSLQTQEGFLGAGNYGISRMNGGFASRCGVSMVPSGHWGRRWRRDIAALYEYRDAIATQYNLRAHDGVALVWLKPWDGQSSLAFTELDPWYIEICRRVRLTSNEGRWTAYTTGTKVSRIDAKSLNGATGDAWMPVETTAKALTISNKGFDYSLATELLFGNRYQKPAAQHLRADDGETGVILFMQGVTRGQGKTEGYHERRVPISPRMRHNLLSRHTDPMAKVASERIAAIANTRQILSSALLTLFTNATQAESGKERGIAPSLKERVNRYAQSFETAEDARFFSDLIDEIESDSPETVRQDWLCGLASRAQAVLHDAFQGGPRSNMLRYRARSAANAKLQGLLHSAKAFPAMANALQQRSSALFSQGISDVPV